MANVSNRGSLTQSQILEMLYGNVSSFPESSSSSQPRTSRERTQEVARRNFDRRDASPVRKPEPVRLRTPWVDKDTHLLNQIKQAIQDPESVKCAHFSSKMSHLIKAAFELGRPDLAFDLFLSLDRIDRVNGYHISILAKKINEPRQVRQFAEIFLKILRKMKVEREAFNPAFETILTLRDEKLAKRTIKAILKSAEDYYPLDFVITGLMERIRTKGQNDPNDASFIFIADYLFEKAITIGQTNMPLFSAYFQASDAYQDHYQIESQNTATDLIRYTLYPKLFNKSPYLATQLLENLRKQERPKPWPNDFAEWLRNPVISDPPGVDRPMVIV